MDNPYNTKTALRTIEAGVLRIAYQDLGPAGGPPVILLHGFPYDIHAFAEVAPPLALAGCRVIVPFLRGFGESRFLHADTPRSGQQAAMGYDLLMLMDALAITDAVLAGYDWGGRAACIVAALYPERVRGLLSGLGYGIQNIAQAPRPAIPSEEHKLWYQYYLHGERGVTGLQAHRHAFCRLLWEMWSPDWHFDDATYARTAQAFDNPDFVAVVTHSYRHRFGLVEGDPMLADWEARLAKFPAITVPSIAMDGQSDGVAAAGGSAGHREKFGAAYTRIELPGVGHNLPQEAPAAFVDAALRLAGKA